VSLTPFSPTQTVEDCGTIKESNEKGSGHQYTIDCRGKVGRFVYITLPGKSRVLNLDVVEVYQEGCRQIVYEESATGKTCLQYSDFSTTEILSSARFTLSAISSAICNPPRGLPGSPGGRGGIGEPGVGGKAGLQGENGTSGENGTHGEPGAEGPPGAPGAHNEQGEPESSDDYVTQLEFGIADGVIVTLAAIACIIVSGKVDELRVLTPKPTSTVNYKKDKKEEEEEEEAEAEEEEAEATNEDATDKKAPKDAKKNASKKQEEYVYEYKYVYEDEVDEYGNAIEEEEEQEEN